MCLSELCTEQILWWQHVRPCGCQSEGASPSWWILVPSNQARGGKISNMKQSWFHNIQQKVRMYPSQLKRAPLIPQMLIWQSRMLLSIPQLEEDKDLHKDWPWLGKVVDKRNNNTKIGKGYLCRGVSCQKSLQEWYFLMTQSSLMRRLPLPWETLKLNLRSVCTMQTSTAPWKAHSWILAISLLQPFQRRFLRRASALCVFHRRITSTRWSSHSLVKRQGNKR